MDPQLPAQLAQYLAPSLRRRVGATPAAFVKEASRWTVNECTKPDAPHSFIRSLFVDGSPQSQQALNPVIKTPA